MSRRARQRPRARAAAVPLPRGADLLRFVPSGRSLGTGAVIAVLAFAVYLAARESSAFAIREISVTGVSPELAADVRAALTPLDGRSLLKLDAADVESLATTLPQVASVSYDRAFPNTLRVTVTPEVPLAVARQGSASWLVSRRGRIVEEIDRGVRSGLPRIWLPRTVELEAGGTLSAGGGAEEVAALAPLREAGLAGRTLTVRIEDRQLTYVLRGGLELRAGAPTRLPLKLEIARRILASMPVYGYLDVSVPERPVGADNPQLFGGG